MFGQKGAVNRPAIVVSHKKRVKSVNDARVRSISKGSVLGPRAMTATFGSRYPLEDVHQSPFGLAGTAVGGGAFGGYMPPLPIGGGLGELDELDELRDSSVLTRARSTGPGILSTGLPRTSSGSSGTQAMFQRERGRGPQSMEARVAAAGRYNSGDMTGLGKTQV